MNKKKKRLLIYICFCITFLITIIFSFSMLAISYKKSTFNNSKNYLIELTNQIKLYVNESLNNNWKVTENLKESIENESYIDSDQLLEYINKQIDLWNISNIYLINKDGECIDKNGIAGKSMSKDVALDYLYEADNSELKRYFFTEKESSHYIMNVDTSSKLNGEEIIGIIVVKDLTRIIGDIDTEYFNNQSTIYLTDINGVIYSKNNNRPIYNVYNILENVEINNTEKTFDEIRSSNELEAFSAKINEEEKYVIISPTRIIDKMWNIIYIIPVLTINQETNSFYSRLIWISSILIIILSITMLLSFITVYHNQKIKYSARIYNREKMIELVTKQTNYVFGLLKIGEKEPIYISSNYSKYMNKEIFNIEKINNIYQIKDNNVISKENMDNINRELEKWDGCEVFKTPPISIFKDNKERFISIALYPTNNVDNEYILISNDITDEIEKEKTLKDSLKLANSANKAKTEFLANMSHDIRTPMNAILNMTDFAINNINNKDELRYNLEIVKSSSRHLLKLINDVLEVSRIESGKTIFNNENFNINEKINDVIDVIKVLCDYKKQELKCDFKNVKHDLLIGDSLKLSQILINILNNASKFTRDNGKIEFKIEELDSIKSEIAPYRFTISDNGIGIKSNNLEKIFKPFLRVNKEITNNTEGTGLGLTIAKNYIEGMGGHIEVESEFGKGTTFIIEIPFIRDNYRPIEKKFEEADQNISFNGRRALLVEDNDINIMISKILLENIGFNVEVATNGKMAINMFKNHGINYYDIIYMDVQMPIMNGYVATSEIRKLTRIGGDTISIIAMTANVFQEDIENARINGMNAHIGKPINIDELINITSQFIRRS